MVNTVQIVVYTFAVILIIILIWGISKQVKEHMLQDDPMLHLIKRLLLPIHPAVKDLKLYKGDKSYTINKQRIFLCLTDKKGEYYGINHLIFVALHELSHLIGTTIGHTPEFYQIFDELLAKARALGIYTDSIPIIQDYCE